MFAYKYVVYTKVMTALKMTGMQRFCPLTNYGGGVIKSTTNFYVHTAMLLGFYTFSVKGILVKTIGILPDRSSDYSVECTAGTAVNYPYLSYHVYQAIFDETMGHVYDYRGLALLLNKTPQA